MERGLLKIEEAAAYLAIGRSKTYELVQSGELPSVKIGRATRVPMSSLKAFADHLANDATAALGGRVA